MNPSQNTPFDGCIDTAGDHAGELLSLAEKLNHLSLCLESIQEHLARIATHHMTHSTELIQVRDQMSGPRTPV